MRQQSLPILLLSTLTWTGCAPSIPKVGTDTVDGATDATTHNDSTHDDTAADATTDDDTGSTDEDTADPEPTPADHAGDYSGSLMVEAELPGGGGGGGTMVLCDEDTVYTIQDDGELQQDLTCEVELGGGGGGGRTMTLEVALDATVSADGVLGGSLGLDLDGFLEASCELEGAVDGDTLTLGCEAEADMGFGDPVPVAVAGDGER